jgi:hypothetical protein
MTGVGIGAGWSTNTEVYQALFSLPVFNLRFFVVPAKTKANKALHFHVFFPVC